MTQFDQQVLRQVNMPCHKPDDGDEFAATAELPGMRLCAAVVGNIAQHLDPHPKDDIKPVVLVVEQGGKPHSGIELFRRATRLEVIMEPLAKSPIKPLLRR